MLTKSGLMVGLGETMEEVVQVLRDLRSVGCDIVTIGQYIRPTARHLPVARYVTPEEFAELEELATNLASNMFSLDRSSEVPTLPMSLLKAQPFAPSEPDLNAVLHFPLVSQVSRTGD